MKPKTDARPVLNRTRVGFEKLNGSVNETRGCLADQKAEYGAAK